MNINLEYREFEQAANRKRWSIVLSNKYGEGSYITLHEWKEGKNTGRKIFCQVRSCRDIYAAGVSIGSYYAEGHIPINPPMFYLIEYVPMLADKNTVLNVRPKEMDSEESLMRYVFNG